MVAGVADKGAPVFGDTCDGGDGVIPGTYQIIHMLPDLLGVLLVVVVVFLSHNEKTEDAYAS